MREIKFRAWDKDNNEMLNIQRVDIADGSCYTHLITGKAYDYWNNVVLMQDTGLRDKNGKEIYEGDIITIDCYSYEEPEGCVTGEVVYSEGNACFAVSGKGDNDAEYECTPICEIYGEYRTIYEVIGNIYKNPEIMEEL